MAAELNVTLLAGLSAAQTGSACVLSQSHVCWLSHFLTLMLSLPPPPPYIYISFLHSFFVVGYFCLCFTSSLLYLSGMENDFVPCFFFFLSYLVQGVIETEEPLGIVGISGGL